MFRSLNTYPRLADEMIEGNPDLTTDAELEDAAIRFSTVSIPVN
jgi:Bacterial archaeo-eukaryotic release factor family 8